MTKLRKAFEFAAVVGGLTLAAASANAQSASTSNNAVIVAGKDAKAVHADQATIGIQNGNPSASGGVADGARVGDNKVVTSTNVTASTQSASVGNNTAVKAGSDVAVAHSDHATVGISNGNINVDAQVADGVRIGNNKVILNNGGHVSVPVIDAVVPGASVVKKVLGF